MRHLAAAVSVCMLYMPCICNETVLDKFRSVQAMRTTDDNDDDNDENNELL